MAMLRVKVSQRLLGELESAAVRLRSDAEQLVRTVRLVRDASNAVVHECDRATGSDPELEMVLDHDVDRVSTLRAQVLGDEGDSA